MCHRTAAVLAGLIAGGYHTWGCPRSSRCPCGPLAEVAVQGGLGDAGLGAAQGRPGNGRKAKPGTLVCSVPFVDGPAGPELVGLSWTYPGALGERFVLQARARRGPPRPRRPPRCARRTVGGRHACRRRRQRQAGRCRARRRLRPGRSRGHLRPQARRGGPRRRLRSVRGATGTRQAPAPMSSSIPPPPPPTRHCWRAGPPHCRLRRSSTPPSCEPPAGERSC